jgi:hypothetical protein
MPSFSRSLENLLGERYELDQMDLELIRNQEASKWWWELEALTPKRSS